MIGAGSFGEVCLSWWEGGHVEVAVKANGVNCVSVTTIDNERKLLELLLQRPHRNILVVYGIVTDAPDGNVRLVMAYCPGCGLDGYLNSVRESGEVRNNNDVAGREQSRFAYIAKTSPLHNCRCSRAVLVQL